MWLDKFDAGNIDHIMKWFKQQKIKANKTLPYAVKLQETDNRKLRRKIMGTWRWTDLSRKKRTIDPLCEPCREKGKYTPATEVHHKKAIISHPHLAFKWDNLQSICHDCHAALTPAKSFQFLHH